VEAQQRQLHHAVELEDLKAELEKEKLYTEMVSQQARRRMMENAASAEPDPAPPAGSASPPPPVEEDLPQGDLHKIALKGVLNRTKSDRSWKDWQEGILRDYETYTARQIIDEATRLYDELNR
jgi:hemolysin activation/secretion protein